MAEEYPDERGRGLQTFPTGVRLKQKWRAILAFNSIRKKEASKMATRRAIKGSCNSDCTKYPQLFHLPGYRRNLVEHTTSSDIAEEAACIRRLQNEMVAQTLKLEDPKTKCWRKP